MEKEIGRILSSKPNCVNNVFKKKGLSYLYVQTMKSPSVFPLFMQSILLGTREFKTHCLNLGIKALLISLLSTKSTESKYSFIVRVSLSMLLFGSRLMSPRSALSLLSASLLLEVSLCGHHGPLFFVYPLSRSLRSLSLHLTDSAFPIAESWLTLPEGNVLLFGK